MYYHLLSAAEHLTAKYMCIQIQGIMWKYRICPSYLFSLKDLSFLSKRMQECDGTTNPLSFRQLTNPTDCSTPGKLLCLFYRWANWDMRVTLLEENLYHLCMLKIHLTWRGCFWILDWILALGFSVLSCLPLSLTRQTMSEMHFGGDLKKYTCTKCHQAFSHRGKY